jgi:HlyD family secretion protein
MVQIILVWRILSEAVANVWRKLISTRILLDAYPGSPIPAKVSFIASQAQFTPKTVETQSEREKLMFRIRVRINPDQLLAHADAMQSGLPGAAYVRAAPNVAWPNNLQGAP